MLLAAELLSDANRIAGKKRGAMVLIIGAGVAGLAASKCLNDMNISHQVIDRYGVAGGAYLRMYPRTQLSSPPSYLGLPGGPQPHSRNYLQANEYASYVKAYAKQNGIRPIRREVTNVIYYDSGFLVTFSDSAWPEEYRAIVVCTGMFDNPYTPSLPGLMDPAGKDQAIPSSHACRWNGPASRTGKRILIIGGGMTAIELAEECVRSGINPILSIKRAAIKLFPQQVLALNPRLLVYPLMRWAPVWMFRRQCLHGWRHRGINRGFREYRKRQLLDVRPMVQGVQSNVVSFSDGSSAKIDEIVFATGYRFNLPFLPDSILRGREGIPLLRHCQSIRWPGLFFLGIPCASSASSHFIHGITADARVVAEAINRHSMSEIWGQSPGQSPVSLT
jgi:putative flavoprotein involved in K+ transport